MRPQGEPVVLVADDEPGCRDLVKWLLRGRGWEIVAASDGAEAYEIAKRRRIALLITDLTMPGSNGLELLDNVKALQPEAVVIVLTGFGTVETAVEAMRRGALDFILKPADMVMLERRISEALKSFSPEAAGRGARP